MVNKILICHPAMESELNCIGLDIRFNPCMDKYRKTGRYILPDGSCVLPEDVVVSDRFTEYGYDDIWYLLWAGIIREEEAALFYLMEEPPDFLRQPVPLFESDHIQTYYDRGVGVVRRVCLPHLTHIPGGSGR